MSKEKVERKVGEKNKSFAELMEEVANLEPQQQEKLTLFVQGYVAGAVLEGVSERKKAI